jgi:hypothetical protein
MTAMLDHSRFMYRDPSSVLPHCRKVMGEEDRIENLYKKGYRPPWEILQGPIRDTVRARSLAYPETPDWFLNLLGVC